MEAELPNWAGGARVAEADELPAIREVVARNELTLFVEAPPLIQAMVRDIRQARRRVWLEIYIFLDDGAGRPVAEALKERARAGLDVRVLYDAIGSQTTPRAFFRELEAAGVRVHSFHSLWEAFARFSPLRILNRRNHRKLLVIDDRVAYFGGMNLVDQTQATPVAEADQQPLSAGWRDVHVRLTGPGQVEVANSFQRSWRLALHQKVRPRPYLQRQAMLDDGAESIQFFDLGPGASRTRATRLFLRLLRSAQRSVRLSMAYFLPVGSVLRELIRTRKRGVRVEVVVPGESDVPLVQHATRYLYGKLLRRRFRIYERLGNMLHSKVMVVDDEWTVLGSCNLDARSLWINLEFVAVVHSRPLAQRVNEIIRDEMRHSRQITLREYQARDCWQRVLDRSAWTFRWWL